MDKCCSSTEMSQSFTVQNAVFVRFERYFHYSACIPSSIVGFMNNTTTIVGTHPGVKQKSKQLKIVRRETKPCLKRKVSLVS